MEHSMEEAMIYYERFEYLIQFHKDTLLDYLDRFYFILNNAPANVNCYDACGRPKDFLVEDFLAGLLPRERCTLDHMAGGSILNCTGTQLWKLIHDKTIDLSMYGCEAQPSGTTYANLLRTYDRLEFYYERKVCVASKKLLSESVQVSLESIETKATTFNEEDNNGDEESPTLSEEYVEDLDGQNFIVEDFMTFLETPLECEEDGVGEQDDTFLPESTKCITDQNFSAKDLIPSNYLDMITTLNRDVVSWPLARTRIQSEKPLKLLDLVATNWKKRKKFTQMNIQVARTCKQLSSSRRSNGARCLNWKSRKRKKDKLEGEKVSSYFWIKQQRHYLFGWKPGWDLKRISFREGKLHGGSRARKFDGVHPWAPNL